jgi:hypothetical protein
MQITAVPLTHVSAGLHMSVDHGSDSTTHGIEHDKPNTA